MKKIMILGASILQLPAIIEAKRMGLQVIAVDMDQNAVGFKYADVCLKISTLDTLKVVEAAKQYKIDGVMTLASDMPMRTVAAVAKALNLAGISEETAIVATNKARMRERLSEHGVPIPNFIVVSNFEEYLNAAKKFSDRFIVKPADNSGSRGIFLVNNSNEVKLAYEYSKNYSRSGEVVVEDYMQGHEVSVETLTINGITHVITVTDKLTTGSPNFVEMGHSQPSILSEEITTEIAKVTTSAINAIGIENGPSHTEIMVTKEGSKIVELGARLGGDSITTHLVPLSTGVDMVGCCIKIALGMQPDYKSKFRKGSAIRYFESSEGTIVNIEGVKKAYLMNGVKQITFTKKVGDKINNISSSIDRIGFVIAQSNTGVEATSICSEAFKLINIEVR